MRELPLAVAVALLWTSTAWAGGLPSPTVAYSADVSITAGAMHLTGKVYSAPGMQRREILFGKNRPILVQQIIRYKQSLMWHLLPVQRQYAETNPYAGNWLWDGFHASGFTAEEATALGLETIDGTATTKYQIVTTRADGRRNRGIIWVMDNGIALKGEVMESAATLRPVMELQNIAVGPQDPALFELPTGYTVFVPPPEDSPEAVQ